MEELYRRVSAAAAGWGDDFELIIVDDGSTDRTLAICERLANSDRRLKVVSLTRNFGHQPAVTAGLHCATGDIVAIMDADLQDPPEVLRLFLDKIHEGYDVVYAVRTKRKEGLVKRLCYHLYYRLLKRLATIDIPLDSGDFCLMRRDVVRALNALPERSRFVRGLRTWVGYRQVGLAYERQARLAGEPKYTFRKLLKLALDGIINFSYQPLQLILFTGILLGLLCLALGVFIVIQYLADWTILGFNPRQARGWTSITFLLLFCSAIQMFCIGVLGEYIGRLFEESKQRPIYVTRKRINLDDPE